MRIRISMAKLKTLPLSDLQRISNSGKYTLGTQVNAADILIWGRKKKW